MRTAELRRLTDAELAGELTNARDQLFNLRLQLSTRQLKDSAAIGRARRDIARILTVRRERDLELASEPAGEQRGG
jgi:large subunit ribosomal protein L29